MNWAIVLLRFLHIGFGVFWAGSVFTVARFVLPVASASGPEGQRFVRRLMLERGLTRAMIISGIITVVAGLVLMWRDSGGMQRLWMGSGMGVMISIGALAALGALFTGIRSAMLASRLGKIFAEVQSGAPNAAQLAEAEAIGARLAARARAVAVQLAIAVLCMAVARYVVF